MIDLSPLCPPEPPDSRIRSFPNGRSRSSTKTSTADGGDFHQPAMRASGVPLSFMYDCGFTKTSDFAGTLACNARSFLRHELTP